jgi:serine/threonine protein kinase
VLDTEGEGLSELHTIRLMRQILEGLCFLHDRDIAHLDLKVNRFSGHPSVFNGKQVKNYVAMAVKIHTLMLRWGISLEMLFRLNL